VRIGTSLLEGDRRTDTPAQRVGPKPAGQRPDATSFALQLQRTAGNRATGRALSAQLERTLDHPARAAALALQLQRTGGNRQAARLLDRARTPAREHQLQRDPADLADPPTAGDAGGCGLCYAESYPGAIGPRDAGTAAHKLIQAEMWKRYPDMIQQELAVSGKPVRGKAVSGKIDLAREIPPDTLEIGEIKPADSDDAAINDIDWYIGLLKQDPRYKSYTIKPLELKVPNQPLDFPTLSPDCPTQKLSVANTKGLYLYFCDPTFKQLKAKGCKCRKRRPDDKDPPVVGDRVQPGKPDTKSKPDVKSGGEPVQVPQHLLDLGKTGKVVIEALLAIGVIAAVIGAFVPPLEALEALAAAIGWALGRLLLALGFGIAIAGTAGANSGSGGKQDPVTGKGKGKQGTPAGTAPNRQPGQGGATPGREPAKQPAGGPPHTTGQRTPPKAGDPAKPTGAAGGAKAPAAAHVTQWGVIEGLRLETTWVGQELLVENRERGKLPRSWSLRVTDKSTSGDSTTLTMLSLAEHEVRGGSEIALPSGNVYRVTHPYVVPARHDPDEVQSVALWVAEEPGLPADVHDTPVRALWITAIHRLRAHDPRFMRAYQFWLHQSGRLKAIQDAEAWLKAHESQGAHP
jgi:hypothetical protein